MGRNTDRMMEAWTDRLWQEKHGAKKIECDWCHEDFLDSEIFGTGNETELNFCSEKCVDEFEKENKGEYE